MSATVEKKTGRFSQPGVHSQHDDALSTALARDAYKRERFEFLLRAIFAVMAMLACSLLLNIWQATRPVQIRYFASTPEGRISEILPTNLPIQSINEVLTWGTQAVTQSFTLAFANYQQQLDDDQVNFTEAGWIGFQRALKQNKLLDTVISQQLVTSVVPTAAPVITSQGLMDGNHYGWHVQLPILISFESASARNSQTMTVDMVIVRRPETENPRGLGIAQIIAK